MNELGGNPAMASTLGGLLILVNTSALLAQRYYAFRKAYNVVCIQPLRVKRTSRGRLLALTAFSYAVVGVALIPALAFETRIRPQGSMAPNQRLRLRVREVDLPEASVYFRTLD
jgi:ABC-type Fe3+ transport system permease subunit